MHPIKKWLQQYNASSGSADPREQPLARERALALDHLAEVSPAAVQSDLSNRNIRWLSGSFSQAFDLLGALKRANAASKEEKVALMSEAAHAYQSFYEEMTFWEVTSFWAFVMSCSSSLPMALEAKHINKIAWLCTQQIHLKEDKVEIISLIHVLGSLVANRQLNVKAAEATRTMNSCSDKRLAELVFLFAQSLKPEEGKKWDADKLSFMTLLLQQFDCAFDCSFYRIVDLFLTDSLKRSGLFDICIHLISKDATLLNARALGHFLLYGEEYEVSPDIHPSLWKCASHLDLSQLDKDAIKELLAALFHGKAPSDKESLAARVAFLKKWAAILCQNEYKNEMQEINFSQIN